MRTLLFVGILVVYSAPFAEAERLWRCTNRLTPRVIYTEQATAQTAKGWKCWPATLAERVAEIRNRLKGCEKAGNGYVDMDIDAALIRQNVKKGALTQAEFLLDQMEEQLELNWAATRQ